MYTLDGEPVTAPDEAAIEAVEDGLETGTDVCGNFSTCSA